MEPFLSNKQLHLPAGNKPRRSGMPEFVDCTQKGTGKFLHSGYAEITKLINDKSDDIGETDSEKFMAIMDKVEQMHQHVDKPREQVMDAEALLSLVVSLESCVRSETAGGITPAEFISCLLKDYGQFGRGDGNSKKQISWGDIGLHVSSIFRNGRGCGTMLGPMKNEVKQRKVGVPKNQTRTSIKSQPEEISNVTEEKTGTDKNMSTMFEILRKKKSVKLENLLLNRKSFSQTVENLFALSFLAKDGRVMIAIDKNGSHIVSPRNAPPHGALTSKEVVYSHFIFKFNFPDWKLIYKGTGSQPNKTQFLKMLTSQVQHLLWDGWSKYEVFIKFHVSHMALLMNKLVPEGEELMPVRNRLKVSGVSQSESMPAQHQAKCIPESCQAEIPSMPLGAKVLSRNRGMLLQGQNVGDESPETTGCKRKLQCA